jgi:hypothetical protein
MAFPFALKESVHGWEMYGICLDLQEESETFAKWRIRHGARRSTDNRGDAERSRTNGAESSCGFVVPRRHGPSQAAGGAVAIQLLLSCSTASIVAG